MLEDYFLRIEEWLGKPRKNPVSNPNLKDKGKRKTIPL